MRTGNMADSKIIITLDKNGKEDISLENFNVSYLPYVLGRLVCATIDDRLVAGDLSEEEKVQFKKSAVDIFAKQLSVNRNNQWISISDREPENEGPFFCKEKGKPTVYTNMYWDKTNKIFGTSEGVGYSFITDWFPYPEG